MIRENRWLVEELQVIAADMQDVTEMVFEDQGVPDLRPTLKTFSSRVVDATERVKNRLTTTEQDERNSQRWKFLFETEGVWYVKEDEQYLLYQDVFVEDQRVGRKLLGRGPELVKLVDRELDRL